MVANSVPTILPERQGAVNNYVFELSKRLAQWNTVNLMGRGIGRLDEHNFHVQSFSYRFPSFFSKYSQISDITYSSAYCKYLIPRIQKLNKSNPIHVLHVHNVFETPIAKIINNIFKIRTICSVHNIFKAPLLACYCDKILANSDFMKKFLINEAHLEKGRIEVLPIAVDVNVLKPIANSKKWLGVDGRDIILFIGRKVPYKGPQVLIDALPIICKEYPKTLAVFIGPDYFFGSYSGSYSAILKEKAQKLGVEKNVLIKSFVPDDDLRMYLNAADMLVCPSIWQEPFGKVVIEASACEKPIVATRVGGLPELVKNNENGILIPPNNPASLANAVIHLLSNKKTAIRMGKKGRQIVESDFTYEVASAKCQAIYKKIL
jgi:glycosyltransferase involved in cell wall biosynthesis